MAVRLIDPNNKTASDPSTGKSTFYGQSLYHKENSIPSSERLFIFAQLTATQNKRSVFVTDDPKSKYNQTTSDTISVDLIGYTQQGLNKGFFEAFDGNSPKDGIYSDYNGFGIKSINVSCGLGFVSKVDIVFLDARKGESLKSDPYGFLLSTLPSPVYTLKLKGYYGKGISMQIMLSTVPSVTLDPNTGFMEIKASFVSNTWRPLGNIKLGDLYMLPFLKSNGGTKQIDLKSDQPPKSFYEFITRAKSLYTDLVEIKEASKEQKEISRLRSLAPILDTIISFKNTYPSFLPVGITGNSGIEITQSLANETPKYTIKYPKQIKDALLSQLKASYSTFISDIDSINRDIIDDIGIRNQELNMPILEKTDGAGNSIFEVDFKLYNTKVKAYIEDVNRQIAELNKKVGDAVNNSLGDRFGKGFKPTVKNIIKLICDDVDAYLNILRQANEQAYDYHSKNTPLALVDGGNGGVDILQGFPTYSRTEFYPNTGVKTLVKDWPKDRPDWVEHKLTQDFFNAYIYRGIAESKGEQARKDRINKISISGADLAREVSSGGFDAVKHSIYYSLKDNVDVLIKPYEQKGNYSYPNNNGTPLIDKFRFVDRAYNDIGDIMIMDFLFLKDLDFNHTVWSLLDSLLSHNKLSIHPIENFISYTDNDWAEAFEPFENTDISSSPFFVCLYIGGVSSHNNSVVSDTFSFEDSNLPPDYAGQGDVYAFKVGYGEQNQSYFESINASSSEYTTTREAIMLADDISKRGGTAVPALQGQSLYEIYRTYSYKTSASMPLCLSIQPTLYYDVKNVPIFSGVHLIQNVTHSITADSYSKTTFSGVRVGRYVNPIAKDFATTVEKLLDNIAIEGNLSVQDQEQPRSPDRLVRKPQFEYRLDANNPLFDDDAEKPSDYYTGNGRNISIKVGIGQDLSSPVFGNANISPSVFDNQQDF